MKVGIAAGYTNLDEAAGWFQQAVELAAAIYDPVTGLVAEGDLASVRMDQGRFDEAAALFEEVIRGADARGDAYSAGMVHLNLAEMFVLRRDLGTARRHVQAAIRQLESLVRAPHSAWALSLAATVEMLDGDMASAWVLLAKAAEMVDASGTREQFPGVLSPDPPKSPPIGSRGHPERLLGDGWGQREDRVTC